jgi:hypothetical protein
MVTDLKYPRKNKHRCFVLYKGETKSYEKNAWLYKIISLKNLLLIEFHKKNFYTVVYL